MSYRREVRNLFGKECMTILLNHVKSGKMSDNQLKDFVFHLGELSKADPEDPNILFGNHTRRMSRERDRGQDTELLQVMDDWWEKTSLCDMSQGAAIQALVNALSHPDVSCNALALKLSQLLHVSPDGTVIDDDDRLLDPLPLDRSGVQLITISRLKLFFVIILIYFINFRVFTTPRSAVTYP